MGTAETFPSFVMRSEKKPKKEQRKKKNEGITRRDFVKQATAGTVVLGSGVIGGVMIKKSNESIRNAAESVVEEPTSQQVQIEEQNKQVVEQTVGKTIEEQIATGEEVVLNRATKQAIYEKWLESHSEGGDNRWGMEQALKNMQPWIAEMKMAFKKVARDTGVAIPEEYVYLTIPESYFKMDARSTAQAVGPYQFTEGTATKKKIGLKIHEGVYDEKRDPVLSAVACAKHLAASFKDFNEDWELALADYNGSYTNQYTKEIEKKKRNYDHYLAWREKRLNDFLEKKEYTHKVASGELLSKIAKHYGISIDEIEAVNLGLVRDKIKEGQVLKLPNVLSVKMKKLQDSLENLNYQEKFLAILEVMKKDKMAEKYPPRKMKYQVIEVPMSNTTRFVHVVRKGETLSGMVRNIKKTYPGIKKSNSALLKSIQQQNDIKNPRLIKPGDKLQIDLPVKSGMSLAQIAEKRKIDLAKLKAMNPAVVNGRASLPKVEVRISA